jgi:hypothetical protein
MLDYVLKKINSIPTKADGSVKNFFLGVFEDEKSQFVSEKPK